MVADLVNSQFGSYSSITQLNSSLESYLALDIAIKSFKLPPSVTEAVIKRRWKMTNHKRAGGQPWSPPPNCQKSLLRASRTPPRASTGESESGRSTSARGSWNLRAWDEIIYSRRSLCACADEFTLTCRCVYACATYDSNITHYLTTTDSVRGLASLTVWVQYARLCGSHQSYRVYTELWHSHWLPL